MFFPLSGGGFKRRRGWKVGKRDLTEKDFGAVTTNPEQTVGHVTATSTNKGRNDRKGRARGRYGGRKYCKYCNF